MDGRIFHLLKLLSEKPEGDWTVAEMAKTYDLSPPHFQKLFKSNTGATPSAFLRELRLEKARLLLEDTFFQIKQIGLKTGLTDESHLTREFKNKYGVTPTEFRRQHWDNVQAEDSFCIA